MEEVADIIKKMRNGKCPKNGGISGELIKYGAKKIIEEIYELIKVKEKCRACGTKQY